MPLAVGAGEVQLERVHMFEALTAMLAAARALEGLKACIARGKLQE